MPPAHLVCPYCRHMGRPTARFCGQCGAALTGPSRPLDAFASSHRGADRSLPSGSLCPGFRLGATGRYQIDHLLGKGGFGEAYCAHDRDLNRHCVVKRLVIDPTLPDADQQMLRINFDREARLLVSLNAPGHPNIPEIYEYLPNQYCLVMKYIEGCTLAALLDRRVDGLPEEEALRYIHDICATLVYMHRRQPEPVIHRDIKPANILLDAEQRVWLIDFGLAKAFPAPMPLVDAAATQISGTPGYTPPEQWNGAAEPRSDVYALAVTLYVLLTNYQPSRQQALALLHGDSHVLPSVRQINPTVRPKVEQLVAHGMAAEVTARPTAAEFLDALEHLLTHIAIPPPPEPHRPPSVTDFVGREAELDTFAQKLTSEHLAVITGLAGVGKTALMRVLAQRVGDPGRIFWHTFHADEGIDVVIWELAGFLAWHGHDALWHLLHQTQQHGGQAPSFEVLLGYLLQMVRGQGFLLCFDDVQFVNADPLFNRLLIGLHQAWQHNGGALIVSSRHVPLFAQIGEIAPLAGLNPDDVHNLLTRSGIVLTPAQEADLFMRTEGNAQFLMLAIDVLQHAIDPMRLIVRLADVSNIEHYLLREVDGGLTDAERAVMQAVAVLLGYPGTRRAITTVLDHGPIRRIVHDLTRRHLLSISENETETTYVQHAIVQAFYYDELELHERQAMHQRAGVYYETGEPDPIRAVQHYQRAGEDTRAAELATANVWDLINRGQAQALRHLLAHIQPQQIPPELLIEVTIARGKVATLLRERDEAETWYRESLAHLETLPDTPAVAARKARVCRGMGELLEYESPREALTWLERGLAALPIPHDETAAAFYVRIGAVLLGIGAYPQAQQALETGLCLLPEQPDNRHADAFTNLGVIACSQGDVAHGIAYYQQALQIYQQTQNFWKMINVWHNLGLELDIAGDWIGAATKYHKALELAQRLGNVTRQAVLELPLGNLQTKQGDTAAATTHLLQCIALARQHHLNEYLVAGQSSLADLSLRVGAWTEAQCCLVEAEQAALEMGADDQLAEIYRGWAQVHLAQGQNQVALADAERAVALARDLDMDIEEGMGLRVRGQVLRALEQHAAAVDAFGQSLALLEGRDPYEAARTQLEWGQTLLANGETAQAQSLLHEARETFARLGAQRDLGLVRAVLEASGH